MFFHCMKIKNKNENENKENLEAEERSFKAL
jgi:hypothetical protein